MLDILDDLDRDLSVRCMELYSCNENKPTKIKPTNKNKSEDSLTLVTAMIPAKTVINLAKNNTAGFHWKDNPRASRTA